MKREFNGQIGYGSEFDILIGDEAITEEVHEEIDGKLVKVHYYLSDKPIKTEKAVEQMLKTFYEGLCHADGCWVSGSSWTGVTGKEDILDIEGHSITDELSQHIGKYCYLIIEYS